MSEAWSRSIPTALDLIVTFCQWMLFRSFIETCTHVSCLSGPYHRIYIEQAHFSLNQSQSVLNIEPEGHTLSVTFSEKHTYTYDSILYFTRAGMNYKVCFF